MNQANQKVVIQNANMNLIQIRQFELNYFSFFFSNFGTQCTAMVGFISGSISQVPGFDSPTGAGYFWELEYWVSSALCVGTTIACLMAAFFINVFAQGLAIRGPEGSMINAIEGMIVEQHYVVILFSLTLFFFAIQCMGMYYLMFDSTSALITTLITAAAIIQGYREALRLYNRFYWGSHVTTHFETRNTEDELNDLDATLVNDLMSRTRKIHKGKKIDDFVGQKKSKRTSTTGERGILNPLAERHSVMRDLETGSVSGDEQTTSVATGAMKSTTNHKEVNQKKGLTKKDSPTMYGAYLTVRDRNRFGREDWIRRYFLVRGHLLYYYPDKRTFELNPAKPLNKRAIDLEGYTLVAGSIEPPYPITLIPYDSEDIRKVWRFRCDTSGEFERWIQLFSVALADCNPNKQQAELVMVADGKAEIVSAMEDDEEEDEEEDED